MIDINLMRIICWIHYASLKWRRISSVWGLFCVCLYFNIYSWIYTMKIFNIIGIKCIHKNNLLRECFIRLQGLSRKKADSFPWHAIKRNTNLDYLVLNTFKAWNTCDPFPGVLKIWSSNPVWLSQNKDFENELIFLSAKWQYYYIRKIYYMLLLLTSKHFKNTV